MGLFFGGRMAGVESRRTGDFLHPTSLGLDDPASGPRALRLIPMFAATRLIADQIAAAPLKAYFPRADGARQVMGTQPALLRGRMYGWKFQLAASMLLWGNAYGYIVSRDANGWPTAIVWLPPDKVTCLGDGIGPTTFTFNGRLLDPTNVVHIPAYVLPGVAAGVSPVGLFRLQIDTGRAAQQYARDWYDGGGIPAAVLQNEAKTIKTEEAAAVKARVKATLKHGDPFVTGKDWSYTTVGVPAADARWIETMKLTATQVAAIYGVAPEDIGGETGSSLTYATVEQNLLKETTRTIRPWAERIEDALTDLFAGRTYVKFNLDAGVRADLKTRYEAHEIGTRIGIVTNDEARAMEERPPLTPEEKADWQSLYRPTQKGAVTNATA